MAQHGAPNAENVANFHGAANQAIQIGQVSGGGIGTTVNIYQGHDSKNHEFEKRTEFLQSLSSDYRRHKNANPARTPGTCRWFFSDNCFKQWRDATNGVLLHLFAAPGCGKSVLVKALVDEELATNSETAVVLHHFFKRGQTQQESAASAVAAMLHQLYVKISDPALSDLAKPRYNAFGPNLCKMFDELWDLLLETCTKVAGNVVCILDALDECEEEDLTVLISAISTLYSSTQYGPKIKILATSRPYREVDFYPNYLRFERIFTLFDAEELDEVISEEINTVIETEIPKMISKVSQSDQREIIRHLKAMKNRTYLWLHLVLKEVKKKIAYHGTSEGVKSLLSDIPPKVEEAYEGMLNRSPHPGLTRNLLSIVLAAKRPLSVNEANLAMKILQLLSIEHDIWVENIRLESEDQFQESLKDLSGLLLRVQNYRVYFIHETAREYLLCPGSPMSKEAHSWKQSISFKDANGLLGAICVARMSLRTRNAISSATPFLRSWGTTVQHLLLSYAGAYWIPHLANGTVEVYQTIMPHLQKILEQTPYPSSSYAIAHYLVVSKDLHNWKTPHPLIVASYSGLAELSRCLLLLGANVNAMDHRGLGAIFHAFWRGHLDVVQVLLDHQAIMKVERFTYLQPKFLDSKDLASHSPILRRIVEHRRAHNPLKPLEEDLFLVGMAFGDLGIVRLLLDYPAGYCISGSRCRLALDLSSMRTSSLEALQSLLTNQSRLSTIDADFRTELFSATAQSILDACQAQAEPTNWARVASALSVRAILIDATETCSSWFLQLLFEQDLVRGKIKTNLYNYVLERAGRAEGLFLVEQNIRAYIVHLLVEYCPADIQLGQEEVDSAKAFVKAQGTMHWVGNVSEVSRDDRKR